MSGLTAATELVKRGIVLFLCLFYTYTHIYECIDKILGFDVTVLERQEIPGGKVKSYWTKEGLPQEHGFHFFPGCYQNLPQTFAEIPYGKGVLSDLLVYPKEEGVAVPYEEVIKIKTRLFDTIEEIFSFLENLARERELGLKSWELEFAASRIWRSVLIVSCFVFCVLMVLCTYVRIL